MTIETEITNIVIQSVVTVVSIIVIGWKIKESLCRQITDLTIKLGTHIGITEPQKKELYDKIEKINTRVDRLIFTNDLKV